MLDGRWRATVERGLEPVGKGLHRAGITADSLTIIGLVFGWLPARNAAALRSNALEGIQAQ